MPSAGQLLAPKSVFVNGVGYVPQYGPTVTGTGVRFDPAYDCDGSFTSYKFQVHNNCYNYATDIATNTIAQPGRRHGLLIEGDIVAEQVVQGAQKDGLILVGGPGATIGDLRARVPNLGNGHFTALLIAPADDTVHFIGDYHWVRCDDVDSPSWSQKDGPDQVTNFDFAGNPITDPSQANWTVNSGPLEPGKAGTPDLIIKYSLIAYLFVPSAGVDII
jgi:hypothetical protein